MDNLYNVASAVAALGLLSVVIIHISDQIRLWRGVARARLGRTGRDSKRF